MRIFKCKEDFNLHRIDRRGKNKIAGMNKNIIVIATVYYIFKNTFKKTKLNIV